MGMMRRVESSIENAVDSPRATNDAKPKNRRRGDKAPSVQVKELGQKLTKELEAHRVSLRGRTLVSHQVTVYLCPQDYDRFAPRLDELAEKLQRTVAKYARSKKYELSADPEVLVVREPDLKPGYFGILVGHPGAELGRSGGTPGAGRVTTPTPAGGTAGAAAAAVRGDSRAARGQTALSGSMSGAGTAVDSMVVSAGDRVKEFTRSRVILGRGRDVDFRLDDPNVSRRHAALYLSEGRVVVEDLESTNGTMVNGYPVSSTVLGSRDILVIGDTRIKVDVRSGSA